MHGHAITWVHFSASELALRLAAVVTWAVILGFFVLGSIRIVRYTYWQRQDASYKLPAPSNAIGVSILRPLKGIDFMLEENLRAAFHQQYPLFEVLLSVASPTDPAIEVARKIMGEFPNIASRLIVSKANVGVNPKINNLHPSLTGNDGGQENGARYDLVWVLDSNCRPSPLTLRHAVSLHLGREDVYAPASVTHQAPFPLHPRSFGARLEQLFLGTVHTRMYTVINWTQIASCLNGKSNLYRRSDLATATNGGSLATFGAYLAEDNIVGEAMRTSVGPHCLAPDPVWQPLGDMGLWQGYFARRVRWTRLRKHNVTAATIMEPVTECFMAGLYGAWGLTQLVPWLRPHVTAIFAVHVMVWFFADVTVFATMKHVARRTGAVTESERDDDLWGRWWQWTAAWIVRELTALPVWLWAVTGMEVEWRGRTFRLQMDGRATPIAMAKSR